MKLPRGFRGGATRAGIKPSGKPDLIVVVADASVAGAAAFTANRFAAAPVHLSAERVRARATFRAILANAGCANAATGDAGYEVSVRTTAALAERIGATPEEILVASTGVIGVPLDATSLHGLDSMLSTLQMPPGVPVATVSIGKWGARNAGILALQILALGDRRLAGFLKRFKAGLRQGVLQKDRQLKARCECAPAC